MNIIQRTFLIHHCSNNYHDVVQRTFLVHHWSSNNHDIIQRIQRTILLHHCSRKDHDVIQRKVTSKCCQLFRRADQLRSHGLVAAVCVKLLLIHLQAQLFGSLQGNAQGPCGGAGGKLYSHTWGYFGPLVDQLGLHIRTESQCSHQTTLPKLTCDKAPRMAAYSAQGREESIACV